MLTFRPDIRPDFDPAAWSRSADQIAAKIRETGGALPAGWLMNEQPTQDVLAPGEVRVSCPKCGSPHIAKFDASEPVHSADVTITIADPTLTVDPINKPKVVTLKSALPGFTCTAGCGYSGAIGRV